MSLDPIIATPPSPSTGTSRPDELSPASRLLVRLMAVLFALLGIVLFVAPGWAAPNFLWRISPFVAMTMGGWYLGNAVVAWEVARVWRWSSVYSALVMLWIFSLLEAGVLVVHSSRLLFGGTVGWPYLLVLVAASLASMYQIADWVRLRPAVRPEGEPVPGLMRAGVIFFSLGVLFIAIFPILGFGRGGTIFPEPLTVFTLNAFGVFYLSIALAVALLIRAKGVAPVLLHARVGLALLYTITAAALFNLGLFDFAGKPGQMIYLGVYVVVGVVITIIVARYWQSRQVIDSARGLQAS